MTPRNRKEYDPSKAWQVRIARAKNSEGYKVRRAHIVSTVVEMVKGKRPEQMKEMGGFTKVIRDTIGSEPKADLNALNVPENMEWWVWRSLCDEILDIRNDVVAKL